MDTKPMFHSDAEKPKKWWGQSAWECAKEFFACLWHGAVTLFDIFFLRNFGVGIGCLGVGIIVVVMLWDSALP